MDSARGMKRIAFNSVHEIQPYLENYATAFQNIYSILLMTDQQNQTLFKSYTSLALFREFQILYKISITEKNKKNTINFKSRRVIFFLVIYYDSSVLKGKKTQG